MVRRLAVVLLVPAMLLVGCSGGDDDVASSTTFAPPLTNPPLPTSPTSDEPSSDESTTTSTGPVDPTSPDTTPDDGSTTTSSTVTVTSAPDDTTATTQPDEFDWVAIVQGLLAVYEALQEDPQAARVDEFCAAGENECQDIQGEAVRQFDEEGWRAIDYPETLVLDAELSATASDDPIDSAAFVVVSVTTEIPDFTDARVVDDSGALVFNIESSGGSGRANWLLARDQAGEWRVLSIVGLE